MDPLWAILSDPTKRGNHWQLEEFFQTGVREVESLLKRFAQLQFPRQREAVLDFGCGIGRVTRAFAPHFGRCVGLDISQGMIRQAQTHNAHLANCQFVVYDRPDLRLFADGSFDVVYTNIALQHLPSKEAIRRYVREFVRVLKPQGSSSFSCPASFPGPTASRSVGASTAS